MKSLVSSLMVLMLTGLVGCTSEDGESPWSTDPTDTGTGSEAPYQPWDAEQIEALSGGLGIKLKVSDADEVVAAHYAPSHDSGSQCTTGDGNDGGAQLLRELRFATWDAAASEWTGEVVDTPITQLTAPSIGLGFNGAGQPAVAFAGGVPSLKYCGGNDAIYGVKNGASWAFETAADQSGHGGAIVVDPATSDAGDVVGNWLGLAFDSAGNAALVYKDSHFGTEQSSDKYDADAEVAFGPGGWSHDMVDPGEGGGDYVNVAYDADDQPIVVHAITISGTQVVRNGVWASRLEADGTTWTRVQLHTGSIYKEVAIAVSPVDGTVAVAFYSVKDAAVRVRTLNDMTLFDEASMWTSEYVMDPRYDEGRHVSLAYAPDGSLGMAYHRCKLLTTGGGCNQNDEAVMFAIKQAGNWHIEKVRDADKGSCGEYTSLGFTSDGMAHIAFSCTVDLAATGEDTDGGSSFEIRPFAAHKQILEGL